MPEIITNKLTAIKLAAVVVTVYNIDIRAVTLEAALILMTIGQVTTALSHMTTNLLGLGKGVVETAGAAGTILC